MKPAEVCRFLGVLSACVVQLSLAAVHGGVGHGVEGFGHVAGICFDGLWTDSKALLAADGALHHGDSGFGAGRSVLCSAVHQVGEGLLCVSGLGFESLAEFSASARSNVVGGGCKRQSFQPGLEQAGLQGQQLFARSFTPSTACVCWRLQSGLHAKRSRSIRPAFPHAFEYLGGQAEQGFDVGFVGCQDLFCGQRHVISPKRWS